MSDCITDVTILNVQNDKCPLEVYEEVRRLWIENELGNDTSYFSWYNDSELQEEYPVVASYLAQRGVTDCLIHYWW